MKKAILIIDDEEILTKTFTRLLERNGYEVYSAKKGDDALCIAEAEHLDLMISDVRMPGMNGVEAVKQIRVLKPDLPFIFITGFADEQLEAEARALGPVGYLHKPFDIQTMLNLLKEQL